MNLLSLAFKSLVNRRLSTGLAVLTIAISVALLLGIERIRQGTREGFEKTLSGVDLIVGARSGNINLLLYSVFRMGNATNNLSVGSLEYVRGQKAVSWTVPISLGDSHRGFRVVGTTREFFQRIKFGGGRSLEFNSGAPFSGVFEAVIGAEVAKTLKYSVGQEITLSHGAGEVSFQEHTEKPFRVVGVLRATGTPIDRSVHVSLEAITALHVDWQEGAPPRPGEALTVEETLKKNLAPTAVTAVFVGLKNRISVFRVQREVNTYDREPLTAILPGASLAELWQILSVAEKALRAVSVLVFVSSLISMFLALMSTLNERRREMAILRSIGVGPGAIFSLMILESVVLAVSGALLGVILAVSALLVAQPWLEAKIGLSVGLLSFSGSDLIFFFILLLGSSIVGLIPAWRAYQNSLSDGLTMKV